MERLTKMEFTTIHNIANKLGITISELLNLYVNMDISIYVTCFILMVILFSIVSFLINKISLFNIDCDRFPYMCAIIIMIGSIMLIFSETSAIEDSYKNRYYNAAQTIIELHNNDYFDDIIERVKLNDSNE